MSKTFPDKGYEEAVLPDHPVYKMLFDGAETKKIMYWILRLIEVSEGEMQEISIENPQFQALIAGMLVRIKDLETLTSDLREELDAQKLLVEKIKEHYESRVSSIETL